MIRSTQIIRFFVAGLIFSITMMTHAADNPIIKIQTNHGDIYVELDAEKAPKTVANFLQYVDDKFYTNTIFHRVMSSFMIQGGGFTTTFERKATNAPVLNEADNGLSNKRGTIAMARTSDPHSATAQFFINVVENGYRLDHTSKTPRGWGYTVFGQVTKGMNVVDTIRGIPTGAGGPFPQNVPKSSAIILGISHINKPKPVAAPAAPTAIQGN